MAVMLFFMGANIRIKCESALKWVLFLTKIALWTVHFARTYKDDR